LNSLKAGDPIALPGRGSFQVDDIKAAQCVASEGELPFAAPARQDILSIEASNGKGEFLAIESIGPALQVHLGRYLEFNDFQFTQLRQLDGWS
jgi:hypothetical protein